MHIPPELEYLFLSTILWHRHMYLISHNLQNTLFSPSEYELGSGMKIAGCRTSLNHRIMNIAFWYKYSNIRDHASPLALDSLLARGHALSLSKFRQGEPRNSASDSVGSSACFSWVTSPATRTHE